MGVPAGRLSRWRREFSDVVDSYEEYQTWLTGMERQAEQRGTRGAGAVDDREMLAELAAMGAQNTPENRAAIIGLIAACRRISGISK